MKAPKRDPSVSALVRDLVTRLAGRESDFDRRKRLQGEVMASIREFRVGTRLSRKEAHDRAARRGRDA